MSRELEVLRSWAADRAELDEDGAARPLWAQIAAEVGAYLEPGETIAGPEDMPLFADGGLVMRGASA
jgi:hypothetical protein